MLQVEPRAVWESLNDGVRTCDAHVPRRGCEGCCSYAGRKIGALMESASYIERIKGGDQYRLAEPDFRDVAEIGRARCADGRLHCSRS